VCVYTFWVVRVARVKRRHRTRPPTTTSRQSLRRLLLLIFFSARVRNAFCLRGTASPEVNAFRFLRKNHFGLCAYTFVWASFSRTVVVIKSRRFIRYTCTYIYIYLTAGGNTIITLATSNAPPCLWRNGAF